MITLAASAHCQRCDWTAAGGWAEVDRAAERHVKQAQHPTGVTATPATTTTGGQRP